VIHRSIRLARVLVLVPAVVMAAGACFATRNDVRTLQGDLAVLRAENLRADSLHRAQVAAAAVQAAAISDSLRAVTAFLVRFSTDVSRFQGDLSINMHTFGQQLLTVQEQLGQSAKRIQDMRAEFERQQADLLSAAQPTAAPGLQGAAAAPPTGPSQLFEAGKAQFNKGAYGSARAAFGDFIAQFPNNDRAGEAQYLIARSFDLENNAVAADSAYAIVVEKYPKAEFAAPALYKRALMARSSNQTAKAKEYFQRIIDSYPRSPEASLAPDALKELLNKP
jgi:tol-pal system protein YbgF